MALLCEFQQQDVVKSIYIMCATMCEDATVWTLTNDNVNNALTVTKDCQFFKALQYHLRRHHHTHMLLL